MFLVEACGLFAAPKAVFAGKKDLRRCSNHISGGSKYFAVGHYEIRSYTLCVCSSDPIWKSIFVGFALCDDHLLETFEYSINSDHAMDSFRADTTLTPA